MTQLTFASATALARAIRERELSAEKVLEAHLRRIAAVNPRLNAVVPLPAESARARARAADQAPARGEPIGPLHGVPFTVKDTLDVAGVIGAMGIPERAAAVAERDATVVARLRAAGAIVLGKTNVPPWGGGLETDNPVYGRTNNPCDPTRTPGGSSGGEAAIIAAGGSPLGLGSVREWPGTQVRLDGSWSVLLSPDGLIEGRQHSTYDIDLYGANTMVGSLYLGALRAGEEMAGQLDDRDFAAKRAQATIVDVVFHEFNPFGISGVVVIAESHLSIHTWPEYKYAAVDIFSCGDVLQPEVAANYLVEQFGAERTSVVDVQRGMFLNSAVPIVNKSSVAVS